MPKVGQKTCFVLAISCCSLFMSACQVYKMDIKQGNDITQEKLNKLKTGMSEFEVEKIMGSPDAIPALNVNRFEYHYSLIPGDGSQSTFEGITLYFKDGKLTSYHGKQKLDKLPSK